jgi:hypothetical protein
MAEIQQNRPSALASDDRIGKPFLLMAGNVRKCLVCEELFSREEALRHSRVVCYPAKPRSHESLLVSGKVGHQEH